jgi:predicted phage tail component-like protein
MIASFNGVSVPEWLIVRGMRRQATGDIAVTTQQVAGRDGAIRLSRHEGMRALEFDIAFTGTDIDDAHDKEVDLVEWLASDGAAALILVDDPTREYHAESTDALQLAWASPTHRRGTIVFTCYDPHPYDATEDTTSLAVGDNTIANAGTIPVSPRIVLPFTAAASFARIEHADGRYVMIGTPASVTETPVAAWTTTLDKTFTSVAGLSAGAKCEGGTIAGTMVSDTTTASPKHAGGSWGTGSTWHGPSLRIPLAGSSADFELTWYCGVDNRTGSMAINELYALDANTDGAATLARLKFGDQWSSLVQNYAYARAGGASGTNHLMWSAAKLDGTLGKSSGYFNNGYVCMTLSRIAGVWNASVSRVDGTGKLTLPFDAVPWTEPSASANIAAIEIRSAAFGSSVTYPVTASCYHKRVVVRQRNVVALTDPVHVVEAGDTLIFDPDYREVRLNGARYLDYFDAVGSSWFKCDPGNTVVKVMTDGTISGGAVFVRPGYR